MIEIDLYAYFWLGTVLFPISRIREDMPIGAVVSVLIQARAGFISFQENTDRAQAFPRAAVEAMKICSVIDEIMTPTEVGGFGELLSVKATMPHINKDQAKRLRELCSKFGETLQQESQHSYVLKVEDQRIFSAYVLVEQIEKAVSPETWKYISGLGRKEIEESGKCLSVERYTASGFHVLRCVESIIREYLTALGVTLTDAERNWGAYVRHLKDKNAGREAISMVDNLRSDDRNTLMHPERFLNMDEAVGLFCLCLTALDRLIKDMKARNIATEFKSESPVTAPSA